MKKIKILMVLGNTGRGGSQSYAMNILRNLDKNRFHVDFAVYEEKKDGFGKEMRSLGSEILLIPKFNGLNYFHCVESWKKIFENGKYDIIHGHATNAAFVYLKEARKAGIKTVIHSHSAGYRGSFFQQKIKAMISSLGPKYADYWFACSDEAARKMYKDEYLQNPHYFSIPNAIEVEKYAFSRERRKKIRKKYGIAKDTKVIGHLGSFSMPKNHSFLLEIFRSIHRQQSNTVLLLCGDGPLEDKIRQKIQELNLNDSVIMTGNIPDVADHLMAMDVMVFPSFFEGLPVSLVEAQATGLPVIKSGTITDEVDLTDILSSLSLEEDSSKWGRTALNQALKENDRLPYNAIVAKTHFNITQSIEKLQNLYLQLTDE